MSDSPEAISRPWWSRLRFSVRTMAAAVLITAALLGWLVRGARVQRQAAFAIWRAGGYVTYDYPGTGTWRGIPVPRWLEAIGIDYIGNIRSVSLQERGSDAVLAHVAHLHRVDNLDLYGSAVTDRGLADLEDLNELTWLNLDGTGICDEGLAHLARLTRLEDLYLDGSRITDTGLPHLEGMQHLVRLSLEQTAITDTGLRRLAGLSRLEKLSIGGTAVTDAGIEELQRARPDLDIYIGLEKDGTLSRWRRRVSRSPG
jgi:hypothetical protein